LTYAFPVEHFGKLYGIARVVGGFSTFLSKPIFAAVVENDNAFKDANIDFTIALSKSRLENLFTRKTGCGQVFYL
jgi:hypothetical protein